MQVLLEAARTTGYYVPGPFLAIAIGRWVWRHSTITLPDGRKWTRGERADWQRAERRRIVAIQKQQAREARARR